MAKGKTGTTPVIKVKESVKVVPKTQAIAQTQKKQQKSNKKPSLRKEHLKELYRHRPTNGLTSYFEEKMLYPDLYGPFRLPRMGGSQKSGCGMMLTSVNVSGATGTMNTFAMTLSSGIGSLAEMLRYCYATGPSVNFNANVAYPTAMNPSIVFPPASQVGQVSITSACMVIEYLGNPLNVKGQVCFGNYVFPEGTTDSSDWALTYNTMRMLPGFVEMPLADLIGSPIRVSAIPLSIESQQFNDKTTPQVEWAFPVVMIDGAPVDASPLFVRTVVNFEYTTNYGAGLIVPYQKEGPTLHQDIDAFQDALNNLGNLATSVTVGLGEQMTSKLGGLLGKYNSPLSSLLKVAGGAALSWVTGGLLHSVCESNGHGSLDQYIGAGDSSNQEVEQKSGNNNDGGNKALAPRVRTLGVPLSPNTYR